MNKLEVENLGVAFYYKYSLALINNQPIYQRITHLAL